MSHRVSFAHLLISAIVLLSSLAVAPASAQSAFPVGLELVAEGFVEPLAIVDAHDDSGRLFVVEKGGTIRVLQDGASVETPFLDITDRVGAGGNEQGLLGLAFAPDYAESGLFYVNYTDLRGNTTISRFAVTHDPNVADPASEQAILRQLQPYPNHNGGHLAFGPDNYLYIGLGDGGSAGDPQGNAQQLDTWLGKMLRIEVDPEFVPDGQTYAIPDDNPFVDEEGALPEIWAYGLRNPWRFSFDRETGDVWIADVGQNWLEEVNRAEGTAAGLNYGWNLMEGTQCYADPGCDPSAYTLPVMEYTHDEGGCSVTGGYVYRGEDMPDMQGTYIFADYCSGLMWGGVPSGAGGWAMTSPIETGLGISAFGEDAAGNLYIADLNGGGVYLLVPPL